MQIAVWCQVVCFNCVFALGLDYFVVLGKFDFNVHNENGLELSIVTIIPWSNYVNQGQEFYD